MTATADIPQDLLDRGMQLSPAARRKFAELLLVGVETGDPELKAKLTQRWEDYQSGKMQALSFEESSRRLQQLVEELEK